MSSNYLQRISDETLDQSIEACLSRYDELWGERNRRREADPSYKASQYIHEIGPSGKHRIRFINDARGDIKGAWFGYEHIAELSLDDELVFLACTPYWEGKLPEMFYKPHSWTCTTEQVDGTD